MTETGRTAYDIVAYPSAAIPETHPDHLATVARLHGLSPPAVGTARVLDIGGGDGMNLLVMAELLPRAQFLSLDLAEAPVLRGRAIAAAAGIGNVAIEVGDIVEAAATLEGSFDYVIAHGVLAWVPEPVRDALIALVGRVLAPDGVAYLSYNALPGGHYRRVVREMTLHAIHGVTGTDARDAAARAYLKTLAEAPDDGSPPRAVLKDVAKRALDKDPGTLAHDELGEVYAPQAFADVVAAGAAYGLRFLADADADQLPGSLPGTAIDDAALVRRIQSADHANTRYFRRTLFVRADRTPNRTLAPGDVRNLYMAASCERTGPDGFRTGAITFTVTDRRMLKAVSAAAATWPGRVRVGDHIHDDQRLAAVFRLFCGGAIELHTVPYGGAAVAGPRPRAGSVARALVAAGEQTIFTLDHRAIALDDPAPRALLRLLDGSRDPATLERLWGLAGFGRDVGIDHALARFADLALLRD